MKKYSELTLEEKIQLSKRLEQIRLKYTRKMLDNPTLSLQDMKEMDRQDSDDTVKITFLKSR